MALSVAPAIFDFGRTFIAGRQAAQDYREGEQRNRLTELALQQAPEKMAAEQELRGLQIGNERTKQGLQDEEILGRGIGNIALQMLPHLAGEQPDFQSALQTYDLGRQQFRERYGKDIPEGQLRGALESGNTGLIKNILTGTVTTAARNGWLKPEAKAEQPASYQEYQLAKQDGFRGNYPDWIAQKDQVTPYQRESLDIQRARLDFDRSKPAGGNAVPSGYQRSADGTRLEFIPGGPADPAVNQKPGMATEDERKGAGWFNQANKAFADMQAAMADDERAAKPGWIESAPLLPEAAKNWSRNDARQKYTQAASAFSEAALRAATGAGINRDEAAQKIRELTPQLGDGDAVIAQKTESMRMYLDSLQQRAGRALSPNTKNNSALGRHPAYGDISEDDIAETMRANNMTREQVLQKLGLQ